MNLDRPIVHLPNFVPDAPDGESSEVESQESKSGHGPFFLFVGRLEKLKGLQTLIPVFRRYAGAKLFVAGTGGYESQLRQLAAGSDRILFLGQQNERQLRNLYKQAVALIMPSICFEMFPLVILEAFQQRTPVIARDLGGAAEAVKESGGGLSYESQEELTGALDRLANDPAYRDELGRLGHDAYLRKWTVEAHLERYLALIHDLEARKTRGTEGEKQRAEAGSTHRAATSRDGDRSASLDQEDSRVEGLLSNR
jgi:glycosyltransferase involved in cell wall biosynthesis